MNSITRRLEKIEEKLHLQHEPNPRIMRIFNSLDTELEKQLPKNVQDWLTYQEKVRKYPDTDFVLLFSTEELYTRGLSNFSTIQAKKI